MTHNKHVAGIASCNFQMAHNNDMDNQWREWRITRTIRETLSSGGRSLHQLVPGLDLSRKIEADIELIRLEEPYAEDFVGVPLKSVISAHWPDVSRLVLRVTISSQDSSTPIPPFYIPMDRHYHVSARMMQAQTLHEVTNGEKVNCNSPYRYNLYTGSEAQSIKVTDLERCFDEEDLYEAGLTSWHYHRVAINIYVEASLSGRWMVCSP